MPKKQNFAINKRKKRKQGKNNTDQTTYSRQCNSNKAKHSQSKNGVNTQKGIQTSDHSICDPFEEYKKRKIFLY